MGSAARPRASGRDRGRQGTSMGMPRDAEGRGVTGVVGGTRRSPKETGGDGRLGSRTFIFPFSSPHRHPDHHSQLSQCTPTYISESVGWRSPCVLSHALLNLTLFHAKATRIREEKRKRREGGHQTTVQTSASRIKRHRT